MTKLSENERRRLADHLSEYAHGVVEEWMRIVDIDSDVLHSASGAFQARVCWGGDGTFALSDSPHGGEEYGTYRLVVHVEPIEVSPLGPEDDGALQAELAEMSARAELRHCQECLDPGEDPLPWCECGIGEICEGPCTHRAHEPEHCPSLIAELGSPANPGEWTEATFLHIRTGDTIRIPGSTDTASVLRVTHDIWHANVKSRLMDSGKWWDDVKAWDHWEVRADLSVNGGPATGLMQYPSDTPVEILCTPERAAQLTLSRAFIGTMEVK